MQSLRAPMLMAYSALARVVERARYFGRGVLAREDANRVLGMAIGDGRGYAAGKLGSIELRAVRFYWKHRQGGMPRFELQRLLGPLYFVAGVFPQTEDAFRRFCEAFLGHLPCVDLMGVWYNPGEAATIKTFTREASLTPIRSLEPYYAATPWSEQLRGKKVLVISPFASSIESQYRRREAVWRGRPRVLPDFFLETIKAPLHDHLVKSPFGDWVEALEVLQSRVSRSDFDVLIVGAGAWSLPLAVFAKKLGKVGIHLGGATQILFGIRGRRWDNHPLISAFFNDAWCRPSADETPAGADRVEGACYW